LEEQFNAIKAWGGHDFIVAFYSLISGKLITNKSLNSPENSPTSSFQEHPMPPATTLSASTTPSSTRNGLALTAVCLVALMFGLEISSVPVILPTLEDQLGTGFQDAQWIMNAYTLACTRSKVSGTCTRNTQRQSATARINAPTIGPNPKPMPAITPHTANARARAAGSRN
jgi:hypothetical protein